MAKSTIDSIMKVADIVDTLDRKGKLMIRNRIDRQLAEKPVKVSRKKDKAPPSGGGQGA